jgi:hypothetical protein
MVDVSRVTARRLRDSGSDFEAEGNGARLAALNFRRAPWDALILMREQ